MHGKKKKKHEVERRKRDKKIFHFWYNILVAAFSIDWLKWFLVLETKFDTELLLLSVFKLSKYFMTHKFLKYYQILKFDFKKFGESQCNKTIQAWLQHLCGRVRDRVSIRHWWLRCRLVTCHCNLLRQGISNKCSRFLLTCANSTKKYFNATIPITTVINNYV
jgi:hypothetical protein